MTALNGTPGLEQDIGGLAALPGLQAVTKQLARLITVLCAEQARRQAGVQISRPAWKNLVFTGGPGTGKSRAAAAVARTYHELGLLTYGQLIEIAAADLTGTTPRETGILIGTAIKPAGDLYMVTAAHTWHDLPDRGQHVLRCLYQKLTEARRLHRTDELAIILAGQAGPLRNLLRASPALSARFPATIGFPGYTPSQLAAVFATLAAEAGFTITPDTACKAAAVLAHAEAGRASGNARLAVRLLTQAAASQAHRLTATSEPQDPATLSTISAADIPEYLHPHDPPADDQRPGQYL
jgi:stage V sporulation protein K